MLINGNDDNGRVSRGENLEGDDLRGGQHKGRNRSENLGEKTAIRDACDMLDMLDGPTRNTANETVSDSNLRQQPSATEKHKQSDADFELFASASASASANGHSLTLPFPATDNRASTSAPRTKSDGGRIDHPLNISDSFLSEASNPELEGSDKHKIGETGDEKPEHDNRDPSRFVTPKDFELLKVIGMGAFGKVLQVRNRHSKQILAMKVISKRLLKRKNSYVENVQAERNILTKIRHPFCVTMHCSFQTKEKLFIIMDFLAGGELFLRLGRSGIFLERTAAFYLAEIILALDHLHSKSILHRDLKPENVLLSQDGHVALTDFGLSKEFEGGFHTEDDEKRARTICGTEEYMSPEMISRSGYGRASDYWSLGCIAYEMLSGEPPFSSRKGRKELFRRIMTEKVKMPNGASSSASRLLKGLLNRNVLARLGAARSTMFEVGGVAGLKQQSFFMHLDWEKLERKEIDPPHSLNVDNDEDLRHFHDDFTKMPLPRSVKEMSDDFFEKPRRVNSGAFRGFSFVQDDFALPERSGPEVEHYWKFPEDDGESISDCASSKVDFVGKTNQENVGDKESSVQPTKIEQNFQPLETSAETSGKKKKRGPRKRPKKKNENESEKSATSPAVSRDTTPVPSVSASDVNTPTPSLTGDEDPILEEDQKKHHCLTGVSPIEAPSRIRRTLSQTGTADPSQLVADKVPPDNQHHKYGTKQKESWQSVNTTNRTTTKNQREPSLGMRPMRENSNPQKQKFLKGPQSTPALTTPQGAAQGQLPTRDVPRTPYQPPPGSWAAKAHAVSPARSSLTEKQRSFRGSTTAAAAAAAAWSGQGVSSWGAPRKKNLPLTPSDDDVAAAWSGQGVPSGDTPSIQRKHNRSPADGAVPTAKNSQITSSWGPSASQRSNTPASPSNEAAAAARGGQGRSSFGPSSQSNSNHGASVSVATVPAVAWSSQGTSTWGSSASSLRKSDHAPSSNEVVAGTAWNSSQGDRPATSTWGPASKSMSINHRDPPSDATVAAAWGSQSTPTWGPSAPRKTDRPPSNEVVASSWGQGVSPAGSPWGTASSRKKYPPPSDGTGSDVGGSSKVTSSTGVRPSPSQIQNKIPAHSPSDDTVSAAWDSQYSATTWGVPTSPPQRRKVGENQFPSPSGDWRRHTLSRNSPASAKSTRPILPPPEAPNLWPSLGEQGGGIPSDSGKLAVPKGAWSSSRVTRTTK